MGGAACRKIIIDNGVAEGAVLQFRRTYAAVTNILADGEMVEYMTANERRQSRAQVKDAERTEKAIAKFNDKINAFYGGSSPDLVDTLGNISAGIRTLYPTFDAAKQKKALKLSYETCEFAEKIRPVVERLVDFYVTVAEKYEYAEDEIAQTGGAQG